LECDFGNWPMPLTEERIARSNGRSHGHVCSQGAGLRVHGQFSGGYFESKV
jgi:hypothetical protein